MSNSSTFKTNKGFTLIELLVVIAIIGILSAVILASLSTARQKGEDAAIQGDLSTVQTQAEVDWTSLGNTYNSSGTGVNNVACSTITSASPITNIFQDTTIEHALASAEQNSGADGDCGIDPAGTAYSVAFALPTGGVWCIDSTGVARSTNAAGAAYTIIAGSAATAAHPTSNYGQFCN